MSELKKSSRLWNMLALSLVGLAVALGLFLFLRSRKAKKDQESDEESDAPEVDQDEDDVILQNYRIISDGLNQEGLTDETLHRLVTAQAMHETGVFESPVFLRNNNYFGMGNPSTRPTTSTGKVQGFANYESLLDSARDYAMYYKYVDLPLFTNVKDFTAALKKKDYYTDSFVNYNAGVSAHFKKLNSLLNVG